VWLMGLAIGLAVSWPAVRAPHRWPPRERILFFTGLALWWLAADWPIGALGAGYLLSMHQLQYLVFVMIAPPLLLLGTPEWLLTYWMAGRAAPVFRLLTRPLVALLLCNTIVILTHLPSVVDGVMEQQLGSFAVDFSWLAAGLLLWWPVLARVPALGTLSYPARFGYLLAVTVLPGVPAAFFFFANYPVYALYELAPPVGTWSATDDQFLAGIIMKFGGLLVVVTALTILFFRWYDRDRARPGTFVLPPAWE